MIKKGKIFMKKINEKTIGLLEKVVEKKIGRRNNLKKRKGYSLIEMVIVMAIIGILMGIMAPKYKNFIAEAKKVEVKADAKTLTTLVDLYEAMNQEVAESTKVSELTSAIVNEGKEKEEITKFLETLKAKKSTLLDKTLAEIESVK